MLEIKRSIGRGFPGTPGGLYDILVQLQNAAFLTPTEVYFVSKGGNNTTGKSWKTAFTTIEAAITAQTALVAGKPSAEGNVDSYIIVAPGTYPENITTLPFSCTIIGLGIPGTDKSVLWENTSGACIAGTVSGLRLINISFGTKGVHDLLDFNIANNVEISNCIFWPGDDNVVNAISTENAKFLTIRNCKFATGSAAGFTAGIYAFGGANKFFHNCIIENNIIEGLKPTGTGIYIDGNCVNTETIVRNNIIRLTGAGTGISIGATGSQYKTSIVVGNHVFHVGGTAYDVNDLLAAQNIANDNGTVTMEPNMPT